MKKKFRSAAEKRQYEENQRSWEQLKAKYEPAKKLAKTSKSLEYSLSNPPGRERLNVPSLVTSGGSTAAKSDLKYTGENMLGIGMMHKSNLVPIFKQEEAKDISSMRR
jgi:hypothetical protein